MSEKENWYSNEERKLLKKERYFSGSHHYFFEVKEAKNGSKYIVIDQRKKVGDQFIGAKIRLFEDEILEFVKVFTNLVNFTLEAKSTQEIIDIEVEQNNEIQADDFNLNPTFFNYISSTQNWKEFEKYTYYLLKLLGLPTIYNFFNERQAGKADGFFKIGNLAVIYDCTLTKGNLEENKSEQINNYCNQLQQGNINISEKTTEEFLNYYKQVWIITQRKTRDIKTINSIKVKEIAVQDLIGIYEERLIKMSNIQSLEMRLFNL
jgi:hypothetical protein